MFFDPNIILYFRDLLPWAGGFFTAITEIGSTLFYVALILTAYWGFQKKGVVIATYVLMVGIISNYLLKVIIAHPRPDTSYWYEGASEPNYSIPSGHAQLSATFYGWISAKSKIWWVLIVSVILSLLIGLSRIYLGLHYLEDVLLGWGLGIITVIVLFYAEKPISEFLSQFKSEYLYLTLLVFGLLLTLALTIIVPNPAGDNFGAYGGFIIGIAIGLPLEQRFVNFEVAPEDGKQWKRVVRIVLGVVLVVGLILGLAPFLPTNDVLLRTIRYAITTVVGIFVWPLIFKKLNL